MLNKSIVEQYQIPILKEHNHASNLLVLENGDLLCTWFGGSREGKADISIMVSRFDHETKVWSVPVIVSDDPERSEQNPILFRNSNGQMWLVYTAQISVHQDSAVVRYSTSDDDGKTWSKIESLFSEEGTFVRNPPVVLDDGSIILPAYYCLKSTKGFLGNDVSVVKISRNHGKTWEEYKIPGSEGLVHMSVVKTDSGSLIGFFRSRKADYVYRTESHDLGKTWSIPEKTALKNNNASIQVSKLSKGQLAIVFNNIQAKDRPPKENRPPWFDPSDMDKVGVNKEDMSDAIWGTIRNPLSIAVSEDDGKTWINIQDIIRFEDQEGEPEFSYPSIKEAEDGRVHVTFTYLRKYIQHVVFEKESLVD